MNARKSTANVHIRRLAPDAMPDYPSVAIGPAGTLVRIRAGKYPVWVRQGAGARGGVVVALA